MNGLTCDSVGGRDELGEILGRHSCFDPGYHVNCSNGVSHKFNCTQLSS